MNVLNIFKIAFESCLLKFNKYYFFVLVASLTTIAIIMMFQTGRIIEMSVGEGFEVIGIDNIELFSASSTKNQDNGLTISDLKFLKNNRINDISLMHGVISRNAGVSVRGMDTYANVKGVSFEYSTFNAVKTTRIGGFIADGYENFRNIAVVSTSFAERYFKSYDLVGRTILLDNLDGNVEQYQIVGVVEDDESIVSGKLSPRMVTEIYIPIGNATSFFGTNSLDYIEIKLNNPDLAQPVGQRVISLLERVDTDDRTFAIRKPTELLNPRDEINFYTNIAFASFAVLTILIAFLAMIFAMDFSVKTNMDEFATRKLLGASRKEIQVQVLSQGVLLSIAGVLFGAILGIILVILASAFMGFGLYIPLQVIVGTIAIIIILGILASLLPAYRAGKVEIKRYILRD